jgi:hypothetical protein
MLVGFNAHIAALSAATHIANLVTFISRSRADIYSGSWKTASRFGSQVAPKTICNLLHFHRTKLRDHSGYIDRLGGGFVRPGTDKNPLLYAVIRLENTCSTSNASLNTKFYIWSNRFSPSTILLKDRPYQQLHVSACSLTGLVLRLRPLNSLLDKLCAWGYLQPLGPRRTRHAVNTSMRSQSYPEDRLPAIAKATETDMVKL